MATFSRNRQFDLTLKAIALIMPHQIIDIGGDVPPVNAFHQGNYVKCGYLWTLEKKLLKPKKWLKKFCVLTREHLFIYADEKSNGCEKCTVKVQLKKFVKCQLAISQGDYYEFALHSASGHSGILFSKPMTLVFGSPELTDAEDWIDQMQALLTRLNMDIYNDSVYGFNLNIKSSQSPEESSAPPQNNASKNKDILCNNSEPKSILKSKKDLTYSYSSSEDEKSDSRSGSFIDDPISHCDALTIRLTPRSLRSTKLNPKRSIPPLLMVEKPDSFYNEITTLPQDHTREFLCSRSAALKSSSTSSLSCISEVMLKNNDDSKQMSQIKQDVMAEMVRLKKHAASMEGNLTSTRNEMTNLQDTLGSLQNHADTLEKRLKEFADHIKSSERQAKILLNDLRIKSEILDLKIAEVDNLKKELFANQASKCYQTFPKKRSPTKKEVDFCID